MAYSYTTYTGTGATTDYTLSFLYLDKGDVFVYVNDVSVPFTWLNSSAVRCSTAPASGTKVQLQRITQKTSPPVNFTDGAVLLETDLDTLVTYTLYIAQEQQDATAYALGTYGTMASLAAQVQGNATSTTASAASASSNAVIAATAASSVATGVTAATTQAANAAASAVATAADVIATNANVTAAALSASQAAAYAVTALLSDYGLLTGVATSTDYGSL